MVIMGLFRRLGLGLATSIFTLGLFVFTIALGAYMVLDKPANVKGALKESGVYPVLVENTLAQKQQMLGRYLPVTNPEVGQAVDEAFSATYLQNTIEHNVDATYDWIHGLTQQPNYSANLSEPKAKLAENISLVVTRKLDSLPLCTNRIETPTTVADVLAMECRPPGVPNELFIRAAQEGIENSNVFDQVVTPVLTLQDEQGQSLTQSLDGVPKAYGTFKQALLILPVILALTAVAMVFWSVSRRQGLRAVGRNLVIIGIVTILVSLAAVWAMGKGAGWMAGSNNNLVILEGKIVTIAELLGAQLRNWLMGISAGYIFLGISLLVIARIRSNKNAEHNQELNSSLGYSSTIPKAGTTFDPSATAGNNQSLQTAKKPTNQSVNPRSTGTTNKK